MAVSGDLKNIPYRVSFDYINQNGILMISNFRRYTTSVNLIPSFPKNYLKFNINVKVVRANQRCADDGAIGATLTTDPTQPVYDSSDVYKNFGRFY